MKNGIRHVHRYGTELKEMLVLGGGGAEVMSSHNLGKILGPAHELEARVIAGSGAALASHTSVGMVPAASKFLDALAPHLPWAEDWCVSLQCEGTSAVFAAIDLLLQRQPDYMNRQKVGVGALSYHGPGVTAFGDATPLWQKGAQLKYPIPSEYFRAADEPHGSFHERIWAEQQAWLDQHAHELGVMVVEPQWGISCPGQPWPVDYLRKFIKAAQDKGVFVLADEIMCGLGRHGQGTYFLSDAWKLDPDAVTFGKGIGGGVDVFSGCAVRGASEIRASQRTVFQSHTYAHGAQARPLVTGTEILRLLPSMHSHIAAMGKIFEESFSNVQGFRCQGQGLLWGGLWPGDDKAERIAALKEACAARNVAIFCYGGGFLLTPPLDVDEQDLREGLTLLVDALNEVASADQTVEVPVEQLPVERVITDGPKRYAFE